MNVNKGKILIVDDDKYVNSALFDSLSAYGYTCTAAFNGNEAITFLDTLDFNIVLLDLKLPDLSGIDVLRDIYSKNNSITIIVITAVNEVEMAVKALKLGASDYIVKPFNLVKIKIIIDTLINTAQGLDRNTSEIDAIAIGVEAKYNSIDNHWFYVVNETVGIARQLGIPETQIQNWEQKRLDYFARRSEAMNVSLDKLANNAVAQYILGVMQTLKTSNSGQN